MNLSTGKFIKQKINDMVEYEYCDYETAYQYQIELNFLVTEIGCSIAGWTIEEIAPMFNRAVNENIENVYLPESFWR